MYETSVYDLDGNQLYSLVQWDRDVYVCIKEPDITTNYDVHFFNVNMDYSYVVYSSYSDGVLTAKIPNPLLREPHMVIGYIYVDTDNGKRSVYGFRIPVQRRPIPGDYVLAGTADYDAMESVLAECRAYFLSATASAYDAENYANLSKSYAVDDTGMRDNEATDNSKYYSELSQGYPGIASNAADAATVPEAEAKASASAALTSETNAAESESIAKQYAIGDTDSAKYYYGLAVNNANQELDGVELKMCATIYFADLPSPSSVSPGDTYSIMDSFTTTSSFVEGEGCDVVPGADVCMTPSGLWNVLGGLIYDEPNYDGDVTEDDIEEIFIRYDEQQEEDTDGY